MARAQIATVNGVSSDEAFAAEPPSRTTTVHLVDRELRHELRNALAAAFAYSAWLRRRSAQWTDEGDRRAVEAVHDSLRLASRLVQDEHAVEPGERCSLRQLAAIAVGQVPPLRYDDVVFNILTDDPLIGRWDAKQVEQILINLLDNAMKYSPAGTPVVVEIARHGTWGRIVVRDQGIGIEAADLEAIFEGYRTEMARLVSPGSGIGLRLEPAIGRGRGRMPHGFEQGRRWKRVLGGPAARCAGGVSRPAEPGSAPPGAPVVALH